MGDSTRSQRTTVPSAVQGQGPAVLEGFAQARGEAADREWADRALWRLLRSQVPISVATSMLDAALDLVRSSREGPGQLFGPAEAWAEQQVQDRAEAGDAVLDDPVTSVREIVVLGAIMASVTSALLLVVLLLQGRSQLDWTIGAVLFPLTLGVTALIALATFERQVRRRSLLTAGLAGASVTVPGIALTVALFAMGNEWPLGRASAWWSAVMVVGYGVLAAVLGRVLPGPETAPRVDEDDEQWLTELAGLLRLQHALPERQVRSLLTEARSHAADSGNALVDEFGAPSAYAAQRGPDVSRRRRLSAWWQTGMTVMAAALLGVRVAEDGWSGGLLEVVLAVALVGMVWLTASAWRATRLSPRAPRRSPTAGRRAPR